MAPAYDTSHRNSTDGSVVWGRTCPNHDKSRRISRYALFRPNFTVRFRAMFTVQGIRPDFTVRFRAMFTVQSLPARFHSAISGHVYSAEPSGQISQCDFGPCLQCTADLCQLVPFKTAMRVQRTVCPDFTVRFRAMFTVQSLPARFHSAISAMFTV